MFFTHFRHLLNIKTLIVVGVVSLVITFLLLMFSEDSHQHGKAPIPNKPKFVDKSSHSEDDKKMFHWMRGDDSVVKMAVNNSEKVPGSDDKEFVLFHQDTRPPLTAPRIAKYCNHPSGQDLGEEGLVSKDYRLLNVHVVTRHGDRSPISRLPNSASQGLSLNCIMDASQFSHVPKVANFVHVMAGAGRLTLKDSRFSTLPLYPAQSKCHDGQLTGIGAIQHILYGMHYSERYHRQHGLFDETNWHIRVAAQTTLVPRTFQSAVSFLYGLLPSLDLEKINLIGSSNINFCEDIIFGSACSCTGAEVLRNKAGQECRLQSSYADVMKKYKSVVSYVQKVLNIEQEEITFPAALMDGLSTFACHSMPPPCNAQGMCLTAKALESIWEPIDFQSNCLHKNENYKKYAKANMHGLLNRIAHKMNAAIHNKTATRFHLYSGHDTTVSPLITAMELEDAVWPGYASRITFELYQQHSTNQHLVRILQNGQVVTSEAVFCQNKTKDGFCNFSSFYNHVTKQSFKEYC